MSSSRPSDLTVFITRIGPMRGVYQCWVPRLSAACLLPFVRMLEARGHYDYMPQWENVQVQNVYEYFTEAFDLLKEENVLWCPYTKEETQCRAPAGLSSLCLHDSSYWLTKKMLVYDLAVEAYSLQHWSRAALDIVHETRPYDRSTYALYMRRPSTSARPSASKRPGPSARPTTPSTINRPDNAGSSQLAPPMRTDDGSSQMDRGHVVGSGVPEVNMPMYPMGLNEQFHGAFIFNNGMYTAYQMATYAGSTQSYGEQCHYGGGSSTSQHEIGPSQNDEPPPITQPTQQYRHIEFSGVEEAHRSIGDQCSPERYCCQDTDLQ
uniref:Aminotransferase-like plant mobile domain-containing protein n=1 Tax=Oryza punctata TaxID=4537 RepID=A0A0E0LAC0_ORYPU